MNVRWFLPSLAALAACAGAPPAPALSVSGAASLGAETSVPSAKKAREMELPGPPEIVRQLGREIDAVEAGGAAERLGLSEGDVLVELDGVELFSSDDINDVLGIHRPGDEVAIAFKPNGDRDVVETTVELGGDGVSAAEEPKLTWHCASLAQLGAAQERAKAGNKGILVGLSGAET